MLNKVKTKALISVGAVAATSFILMMGYTAGQHFTAKQSRKEIELAAAKLVEDKQAEDKASILSSDTVKEFLTQYYTKEKLGENNIRIQPYMTESAYSQELTSQNDAMNQVYKDYILDYHFEKADIFVNQTTNQAIAMVSYNVTYVSDLKNANQSKTNQTETRTVKLSYPRERLKTILKGSHGHVGISFDIGHPNRLVFCESFIDLMSYYELHQQSLSDVRLVSMEGLKRSVVAYQTLRLIAEENQKLEFLDTVIPSKLLPLINTIRDTTSYFDNHPDLLTLAVDCDDAGKDFSDKLSQSGLPVLLDLPDNESGKEKRDWNDILREKKSDLQFMLETVKETFGNPPVRQTSQCLEL